MSARNKSNNRYYRQAGTRQPQVAIEGGRLVETGGQEDDEDEDRLQLEPMEEYTADSYMTKTVIALPSGKAIRIRPYSLMSALTRGELPNTLVGPARELLYNDKDRPETRSKGQQQQQKKDDEHTEGALFDFLCCQMIASFECVERPQAECEPGQVSVFHILECDKVAIVQYCTRGQAALSTFR